MFESSLAVRNVSFERMQPQSIKTLKNFLYRRITKPFKKFVSKYKSLLRLIYFRPNRSVQITEFIVNFSMPKTHIVQQSLKINTVSMVKEVVKEYPINVFVLSIQTDLEAKGA